MEAPGLEGTERLLIVGMGRSGVSAALAVRKALPETEVVICDREEEPSLEGETGALVEAGVLVRPGRDDIALLDGCGLVVKSPGVPGDIPLIREAHRRGVRVWGEVELARRFLKNVVVGVTGTNGKTTTVELIGHILKAAGRPCRVAGNVGTALASLVGEVDEDEVLVVELSSFQLEDSIDFRPEVAVLLNLTEDHLDRHPSLEHYFSSKMRIFANQEPDDVAIVNLDDPVIRSLEIPGSAHRVWFSHGVVSSGSKTGQAGEDAEPLVFMHGGVMGADVASLREAGEGVRHKLRLQGQGSPDSAGRNGHNSGEGSQEIIAWPEASLKGEHNLENCLAAAAACLCLGLSPAQVADGLKSFPGVRHRLQEVAVLDGVTYVNDSKATNVDAAIKALTAYREGIHLILGGSRKGCSFDRLAEAAAAEKVKEVILIGDAAADIAASFERVHKSVVMAGRLDEAVTAARGSAVPGDVVLLAPACASFDQYRNFEERGEHFIALATRSDRRKN